MSTTTPLTLLKYERRRRRRRRQVLPEEILFEILTTLPVKSLLRCTCVCKSWKTLISSPDFISAHAHLQMKNKACDYQLIQTREINCFSLYSSSADTFSKCLDLKVPNVRNFFHFVKGSCNGLLCLSDIIQNYIFLWNPSIRKVKKIPSIPVQYTSYTVTIIALGFGFHRAENDYKVVRVMRFRRKRKGKKSRFEVEVYSLRLNAWRSISAVPPVSYDVQVSRRRCALLNGVVYWMTMEPNSSTFILSFDFGSEDFKRIMLPHQVVLPTPVFEQTPPIVRVSEKSLSFFHRILRQDGDEQLGCFYEVWVLEMDDTWKNTCTILLPKMGYIACPLPLGFTTNGRFLMARPGGCTRWEVNVVLYDPESHQATDTGIKLIDSYECADTYSESLILLN